jgi:hypothetical protein
MDFMRPLYHVHCVTRRRVFRWAPCLSKRLKDCRAALWSYNVARPDARRFLPAEIQLNSRDRPAEGIMQNWKKAVVCGAVGAGAVLALSGRRNVGLAAIAGGLALVASEYPEHFEGIWESAPEYINRAAQIFATLSRLSEGFAEEAERRSVESYSEFA